MGKLEKARRTLEGTMQRQLAIFHQLRVELASMQPEKTSEAQKFRLRLRVVK